MHSSVLVIGNNPEEQLAPFEEGGTGGCPQEYMEFEDKEDEWKDEWKHGMVSSKIALKNSKGTLSLDPKQKEVPCKIVYKSFKEFCKKYHGCERDETTGRYGYWTNPQGRWDWYQIGGRWQGMFLLKPGARGNAGDRSPLDREEERPGNRVSQAQKINIDWDAIKRLRRINAEKNWEEAQKQDKGTKSFMYGIEEGMTKEQYIEYCSRFSTHAILYNGEWKEKEEMFGFSKAENEHNEEEWIMQTERLIDSLPDDTLLTICDLHQ